MNAAACLLIYVYFIHINHYVVILKLKVSVWTNTNLPSVVIS
jgi:hypothetical protein